MSEDDDVLDDMIEEEDEVVYAKVDPRPGDENWEEFVLSKLTSKEIDESGHPSTAGLRRIAPRLLGKIIESGPITVFNPEQSNDHRATIIYELVYINKDYVKDEDDPDERVIRVKEVSDAWEHNIDGDVFKKFPTAIASTRAEGRALRKALMLSVAVKEELSEETFVPVSATQDGPIKDTQVHTIDNLCKRYDISVQGLIEWGKDSSIKDVTRKRGRAIIEWLNNKDKRDAAPAKVRGYKSDWRK